MYFSEDRIEDIDLNTTTFSNAFLEDAICETLFPTGEFESFDVALFTPKYIDNSSLTFSDKNLSISNIYIPMIKYGFGNAICFEMSFESPISAGKQTTFNSVWYGTKYYTIEYLYADEEGWFDKLDIKFVNLTSEITQEFPLITSSYQQKGIIRDFNYLKKPNEIFALNFELVCLPLPNRVNVDFIGTEFVNNNALIKKKNPGKTYFYYETTEDFKYSVLDLKGHGNRVEVTLKSSLGTVNNIRVTISTGLQEKPKAWALCNENGDILVASNECNTFNQGDMFLHFVFQKSRIKEN
jgi:hypothetical protein